MPTNKRLKDFTDKGKKEKDLGSGEYIGAEYIGKEGLFFSEWGVLHFGEIYANINKEIAEKHPQFFKIKIKE